MTTGRRAFEREDVQARFDAAPETHRDHLLTLRETILAVGESLERSGGIEETLKWGEPSYLPNRARVGSTIRLGTVDEHHVALYFNCNTLLVETLRAVYGDALRYSKNRAILFDVSRPLPLEIVQDCVRRALYYHRDKHRSRDV